VQFPLAPLRVQISSVDVTVSIFLNFQYFTNYANACYLSHKNHANITVEAAKSRMLASY